ncbi:hypothetical protein OG453_33920 [Streptomyces sp. NBC_01381]|uniref:F0F1 ATP synthase subunit B family protein n=1 Tax=Streptomyces sp. NBC_01381 TaxID=2903845 RepID=UPI00224E5722|nr:hypothetical protein [Streptomyces sp. NBC_01381]MCX4671629.1 hypothetical protein [Streptomyces sp. NBC_01381]
MQLIAMNLGPLKPEPQHLVAAALLFGPVFLLVRRILPRLDRVLEIRAGILDEVTGGQTAELRSEAERVREARDAMLAEARHDAALVRQRAREEGAALIAAAREDGVRERDELVMSGQARIETERASAEAELRGQVSELASALASRIVGEPIPATAGSGR